MRLSTLLPTILGALQVQFVRAANPTCSSTSFTPPGLQSIRVESILAKEVLEYSPSSVIAEGASTDATGLNFCNVTVTYTHPGWNDTINLHIWLPLNDWNERFMGLGGGGFSAGFPDGPTIAKAIEKGYAAATTNAGHTTDSPWDVESWAMASPGNVNLPLLYDFAFVALNDLSIIGKDITRQYYGQSPKYSYWEGCSTGGRQGLALAQRFPEAFDGILAVAPAINWARFLMMEFWPYLVMKETGVFPPACELSAITAAAVKACDEHDGLADGIIAAPELCDFDPQTVIGQAFDCDGTSLTISPSAVKIVQSAWTGPLSPTGEAMWHGVSPGANFAGFLTLLSTTCPEGPDSCTGTPFPAPVQWIKHYLLSNSSFDISTTTPAFYHRLYHQSVQKYDSIMSFNDPDLHDFKSAGGKMITWHGLDDEVIPPNGTREYYQKVLQLDPEVGDYYRLFEVPGVGHCYGGPGPCPYDALDVLRGWVEEGVAPETIHGRSPPGAAVDGEEKVREQPLCAWPLVSVYKGVGDPADLGSFECRKGFRGKEEKAGRDEL